MLDIEEIILDVDPTSGVYKERAINAKEHSLTPRITIKIRIFGTKHRNINFSNEVINRV